MCAILDIYWKSTLERGMRGDSIKGPTHGNVFMLPSLYGREREGLTGGGAAAFTDREHLYSAGKIRGPQSQGGQGTATGRHYRI